MNTKCFRGDFSYAEVRRILWPCLYTGVCERFKKATDRNLLLTLTEVLPNCHRTLKGEEELNPGCFQHAIMASDLD